MTGLGSNAEALVFRHAGDPCRQNDLHSQVVSLEAGYVVQVQQTKPETKQGFWICVSFQAAWIWARFVFVWTTGSDFLGVDSNGGRCKCPKVVARKRKWVREQLQDKLGVREEADI